MIDGDGMLDIVLCNGYYDSFIDQLDVSIMTYKKTPTDLIFKYLLEIYSPVFIFAYLNFDYLYGESFKFGFFL